MNANLHSESSMKRHKLSSQQDFDTFWKLHDFMDWSKEVESTNKMRILSHNLFFIKQVVIPIFGSGYMATNGKTINWKDEMERHVLEDFKHKFLPNLSDYVELIKGNEATDSVLYQIEAWKIEHKAFFATNPEILDFLMSPLYLTGSRLGLLVTWNSWMVGKILPLVFKKEMPFIGFKPSILFDNMIDAAWVNNGLETLPRLKKKKEEESKIIDGLSVGLKEDSWIEDIKKEFEKNKNLPPYPNIPPIPMPCYPKWPYDPWNQPVWNFPNQKINFTD